MRAQEWKYFVACYGCSFVPALAYLFVNTKKRGRIYGGALVSTVKFGISTSLMESQLWCWVDSSWDFLRVATLYGIVWSVSPSLLGFKSLTV